MSSCCYIVLRVQFLFWYFYGSNVSFVCFVFLLVNRAAMGRTRFMFYPWFFNRAAVGRARFMVYTRFFFVVLSVTRPKPLLARLRMTQLMMFIRLLPFSSALLGWFCGLPAANANASFNVCLINKLINFN